MSRFRGVLTIVIVACGLLGLTSAQASAAAAKPSIETSTPYSVGVSIATLKAQIDPDGADTSYRFEYGASASYGTVVPAPATDIGSGTSLVNVVAPIDGLAPDTIYHYRVVAVNSEGESASPDETFSTFGIAIFSASLVNSDGTPDVYAGSHPFELDSEIRFPEEESGGVLKPAGDDKDLDIELPEGLVGEPQSVPECPQTQLESEGGQCPADSQIGVITVDLEAFGNETVPLYNLAPVEGAPAQFGAFVVILPLTLTAEVVPGRGYALNIDIKELTDLLAIRRISVKLWGVPGDASHNAERGTCLREGGSCPSGVAAKPFLTLPTVCNGPATFALKVDSWAQPGEFTTATSTGEGGDPSERNLTGCESLDFSPSIDVRSETSAADSPGGLDVAVSVPQNDTPTGVGEASLKSMVVKLPQGTSINVAAADGLGGCTPAQIGLGNGEEPTCPDASKIGTAEIRTPLLPLPLSGPIYLAQPHENPFDSEFAAYIAAEANGVLVKLAMQITPDPVTGQLTVKFDNAPQLGFAGLDLDFKGGARAVLATPQSCGTYTTTAQPTSYSEALAGSQSQLTSDFVIDSNCGGGFAPSFLAGSTNTAAGESTGFTLQAGRADGQQILQSVSATLPAGLLAKLGSVPLCQEAQATAGTCGASSEIGTVAIAAGAGSHPFNFSGNVFLTGPYHGAPFGLSIVVPATAGPFDLGLVVIRARLLVNPHDAQLTLATDPLPTIRQGIPLRIRSIDVNVNRSGFMSNPTNCAPRRVVASIAGAQTVAQVTTPFTLAGCGRLPFSPTVSASTQGRVSLNDGASFAMKIQEPAGTHANIGALQISLPARLSARLSTIRLACRRATFEEDPASCPKGSRVGSSDAHTSLLSSPLSGPVYLLSNGRAGRPELAIVLQGQGVVLELTGTLRISDGGLMVVTFPSVPDATISSLDIELPAGPQAVLGVNRLSRATGSLCGKKLMLQSTVTAQNGIKVKRSTRLSVSGCSRRSGVKKKAARPNKKAAPPKRKATRPRGR